MADIFTIMAAVEWMVLGLIVLWKLKKWNKSFQEQFYLNRLIEKVKHEDQT